MDTAGNTMGASIVTTDFTVLPYTDVWINPNGGDWSNPSNWSNGKVSGTNDSVYIKLNPNAQITVNQVVSLGSLVETGGGTIIINGNGSLSVANNAQIADNLTINGGTYNDAGNLSIGGTLNWNGGAISGGGVLSIKGSSSLSGSDTLDGMVLNGVLNETSGNLIIRDGLAGSSANGVSPAINVNNGSVETSTSETLDNLALNFNNYNYNNLRVDAGTTLTLGKNLAVNNSGNGGNVYGSGNLVSLGTINVMYGSLTVNSTGFSNQGKINVQVGSLGINESFTDSGKITVAAGTSFSVSGNLTLLPSAEIDTTLANNSVGSINVSGSASLNGVLNIIPQFTTLPSLGQSYTFMNFANDTGQFNTVEGGTLSTGERLSLVYTDPTDLRLNVVAA